MPFYRLIWLMPAVYAVHIAEEWFGGFAAWISNVLGGSMTPEGFVVNNAGFMAVLLGLTTWAAVARTRLAVVVLIAWASGNLFWNFIFHLATVPIFDRYSPGLATATLLYFPVSYAVARSCLADRVLRPGAFTAAAAIGGGLMLVVIWGGLYSFAT
jgi:hypothetical protein